MAAGDKAPLSGPPFAAGKRVFNYVFTNVYILAWLTGPSEFMTRNKPLRGGKKTAPTSWGRSVYQGPAALH